MIFNPFRKLEVLENYNKNSTVRKTVTLRILSSVATLEVHKSESGVKKNCYKNKKNTIEVISE